MILLALGIVIGLLLARCIERDAMSPEDRIQARADRIVDEAIRAWRKWRKAYGYHREAQ